MSQCPSCHTEGAYVGLVDVECPNPRCCHHVASGPIVFSGDSLNLKTTTNLWEVLLKTKPNCKTTFILAYSRTMGMAVYKGAPPKSLPYDRDCVAVQVEHDPVQIHPWYVKMISGAWAAIYFDGMYYVDVEIDVMGLDQLHVGLGLHAGTKTPYLEFSDRDLTGLLLDSSLPGEILITHVETLTFVERIS